MMIAIASVSGLSVNVSARLEPSTQPPPTMASSSRATPIAVTSMIRPGRR